MSPYRGTSVLFRGRTHDFIVILLYRFAVVIHNHSPKRKLSRVTGNWHFDLSIATVACRATSAAVTDAAAAETKQFLHGQVS